MTEIHQLHQLIFQAYIRPQKAEQFCRALLELDGLEDLYAQEVRGSVRRAPDLSHRGLQYLPKVLVSGVIGVEQQEAVVELVATLCRTGHSGDGKLVFMSPV